MRLGMVAQGSRPRFAMATGIGMGGLTAPLPRAATATRALGHPVSQFNSYACVLRRRKTPLKTGPMGLMLA